MLFADNGVSLRITTDENVVIPKCFAEYESLHNLLSHPVFDIERHCLCLPHMQKTSLQWSRCYDDLLILGTGGGTLGARALQALAGCDPLTGCATSPEGLRIWIYDNLDSHTLPRFLARLNIDRTLILVISKSGATLEVLAQTCWVMKFLQHKGKDLSQHMAVLTQKHNPNNQLRGIAEQYSLPLFEHPSDVGGRYCLFTQVAMLPALCMGLDVQRFWEGAKTVWRMCYKELTSSLPVYGASLLAIWENSGTIDTHVLVGYGDKLQNFGLWVRQLWAESLGKQGQGSLLVPVVAPVDQHSQLQLYLDGGNNKSYTIIMDDKLACEEEVLSAPSETLSYLNHCHLSDVLYASRQATIDCLRGRKRPVRLLQTGYLDEYNMGQLMMHMMLETVLMAHLMQVNPFDQPAVEEGKQRAKSHLSSMQNDRMRYQYGAA